ncbi:MAG: cell division protein FtsW [Lachnospiraceae bacterium]|nr:cell division protein FtsW [Lachnospiraceae bacterium]
MSRRSSNPIQFRRPRGAAQEQAVKPAPRKGSVDAPLFVVVGILLIFGLIMVYSSSAYTARVEYNDATRFLFDQARNMAIGVVVMVIVTFIPPVFWRKISGFVYVVATLSILVVLSPLGKTVNGARRWINLKVMTVQPAELAKFGLILASAALIAKLYKQLDEIIPYVMVLALGGIAAILIIMITDDLGSGIIILAITYIGLIVSCPKVKYLLATGALGVLAVVGSVLIKPYRMDRIRAWLHIEQYSGSLGYQVMQALYAIGSGGFFGKGLGKSTQKLGFVPENENDMIFSIICEELGIVGGIALIALFIYLIYRLSKIYKKTLDRFGRLVVLGVMTHIAVQTIINLAVVTNLIPNTGVPLPFISYGGTSIIIIMAEIGLAQAVSRHPDPEGE